MFDSQDPILGYHGIHRLTEKFQAGAVIDLLPVFLIPRKPTKKSTNRVDRSQIPLDQIPPDSWISEDADINDRATLKQMMKWYQLLWDKTTGYNGPRAQLQKSLRKLVHTARISNIICIGLGNLNTSDQTKAGSILQHIVASSIAQDLTHLYEAEGITLGNPIRIIAQDSAYTALDRQALSELPVPIEVVTEPEGFLAINRSSLVFSSFPAAPVKELIADLATELPDGKGPAALILNNDRKYKYSGDVDVVKYSRNHPGRYPNVETKAYVKMLESYTRVLDGEQQFGIEFNFYAPGFEWLSGMDIWGRED